MKLRRNLIFATSLAVFSMTQGSHGAEITWNAASTITADSDVFNVGLARYAYALSNTATTVNGVAFTAGNSSTALGSNVSLTSFTTVNNTAYSTPTGISSAYGNLTKGAVYGPTSGVTVTLNSLVSGHVYATQIWANDSRSLAATRTQTVTGGGGNTVTLDYNDTGATGGAGQYTLGGFTANAETQDFTITGNATSQLNAIQVRDVTGVWSGAASGSWADAAANFTGGSTWTTASGLIGGSGNVYFADTDGFGNAITNSTVSIQSSGISTGTINFQSNSVNYSVGNASGSTGIAGTAGTAIEKTGNSTLTLAGANTYTGSTVISGGTIKVANVNALGTTGAFGTRTVINNGGTLELATDTSVAAEWLDIASNATGSVIVNRATNGAGITQSVGTTYLGRFTTLEVTSGSNVTSGTATLGIASLVMASGINSTATLNSDTAAISITGSVSSGVAYAKELILTGSHTESAISGVISNGSGTVSLTKSGAGTWTLSNANTYTGATVVTEGVLKIQNNTALGTTAGGTTVNTFAKLQLDGSNLNIAENLAVGTSSSGATIENLSGDNILSGTLTRNGALSLVSTAGSLTVNSGIGDTNNSINLSGAGDGEIVGNITLAFALNKSDSGTWTLSGENTYTGDTTVSDGTLIIDGNISTSTLTTVEENGTLGGTGTTGALTVLEGGFINPGNSTGVLTVEGNYIQEGLYTAEINGLTAGTQHDQIDVTGTVNITGGSLVTLFAGSYSENDLIFILLNDGTDDITGTFTGLAQGDTVTSYGGFDWKISYTANGDSLGSPSFTGGNDIALMAIPEPGAALLGSLGMILLLRRRR